MLRQVADEMGIDLSRSYLVGDAATDLMAGQRVGSQSFLVLTGRGWQQLLPALRSVGQFTVTRNLMAAITHIVRAELNFVDEQEVWSPVPLRRTRPALSTMTSA
jgi:D-glycero-D-manno-heptose 1,7-bisphosphate phosphatase